MHGDFGEETMIYGDEPTERKNVGFNKSTLVLRRKGGKLKSIRGMEMLLKIF
jgi:hypothetical protein